MPSAGDKFTTDFEAEGQFEYGPFDPQKAGPEVIGKVAAFPLADVAFTSTDGTLYYTALGVVATFVAYKEGSLFRALASISGKIRVEREQFANAALFVSRIKIRGMEITSTPGSQGCVIAKAPTNANRIGYSDLFFDDTAKLIYDAIGGTGLQFWFRAAFRAHATAIPLSLPPL